jgi:quercetin dioxygenase-like cupin family protein
MGDPNLAFAALQEDSMPIIANEAAPEVPWRPGYRSFTLAGKNEGLSCSSSMGVVEPGAGAPLHFHENTDEVIIVLEGTLEFRLGDETHRVGANHTIAIPAGVPHAFVAVGPGPARFYGFLPKLGAIAAATYLEGGPPAGGDHR